MMRDLSLFVQVERNANEMPILGDKIQTSRYEKN